MRLFGDDDEWDFENDFSDDEWDEEGSAEDHIWFIPEGIVGFEESVVVCDLCGYEWEAILLDGETKVECPNCEQLVYFDKIKE